MKRAKFRTFLAGRLRRNRWFKRTGKLVLLCFLVLFICPGIYLTAYLCFPPASLTILVSGVDTRLDDPRQNPTDSIILINVAPRHDAVTVLSIPRDIFIEVPGYGNRRLSSVSVLGEQEAPGHGTSLLKTSLSQNFEVEIDRYVRVDLADFTALIDALGGIDIYVPNTITDVFETEDGETLELVFDAGWQHMDGTQALYYARVRRPDDDYHRATRQQQIMNAVAQKLADPRTIPRWPLVWWAFERHIDSDLGVLDLLRIGPGVLFNWPNRTTRVLDEDDLIALNANYWVPDYDTLQPWIDEHFD